MYRWPQQWCFIICVLDGHFMMLPIGVIDSGVGGLTVVHELMRQLPNEQIIYVGDTLRCPYGPRPPHEVQQFTREMVGFLLSQRIKMLVIACNTATAFTLEALRQELSIPVIGVIQPGARAAIKVSQSNQVGVIGTEGTINSGAYEKMLQHLKPNIKVASLACPKFVPMVEQGELEGSNALRMVRETLGPFVAAHAMDTLVLGCTHYPLLRALIQQVVGEEVNIISSNEEVANEVSSVLGFLGQLNESPSSNEHAFYTTGDVELFHNVHQRLFGDSVPKVKGLVLTPAS